MSRELGVVMPFWLDRPDEEAVEIARAAAMAEDRAGHRVLHMLARERV